MIHRPPGSTPTDTLFPDPTLFLAYRIVRHHDAGKVDGVPVEVDVALGGQSQRGAVDAHQLGRRHAVVEHEVAIHAEEGNTLAAQQVEHAGEGGDGQQLGEGRRVHHDEVACQIGRASCRERVCQYV